VLGHNWYRPLAAAGAPIWIDGQARIAHAKTMVIDGAVTLMGSYNWTRGAATNSENLKLVSSPAVAAAYAAHWRNRLAVSVRYERREIGPRAPRLYWEARGGKAWATQMTASAASCDRRKASLSRWRKGQAVPAKKEPV
jgi:phosphatidylserine/phosphatidylglycerophosphate/cardiolipin synthase-like enzyme